MKRFFPILLLLAVFPQVGKSLDDIRRSLGRAAWGEDRGRWGELFRSRTGEELIPEDAREAIHLLRASSCAEYALSDGWKGLYAYQRIVEGAWPIRHQEGAGCRLLMAGEKVPRGCREEGAGIHGRLVRCR